MPAHTRIHSHSHSRTNSCIRTHTHTHTYTRTHTLLRRCARRLSDTSPSTGCCRATAGLLPFINETAIAFAFAFGFAHFTHRSRKLKPNRSRSAAETVRNPLQPRDRWVRRGNRRLRRELRLPRACGRRREGDCRIHASVARTAGPIDSAPGGTCRMVSSGLGHQCTADANVEATVRWKEGGLGV
jgi:hypothetical protein